MSDLEIPEPDGKVIPKVGPQSRDKHHFLRRYIDAFTTSMRRKYILHYVDLFAGAGIEKYRDTDQLDWGSPLLAAQARFPFDCIHCCEKNVRKYEALYARLHNLKMPHPPQCLQGDANKRIGEIISSICKFPVVDARKLSLSLAFLDPYGLHLNYSTLESLAEIRADLIIFFPDHLDAKRNWAKYYLDDPNSNLDKVLGPGTNWRSVLKGSPATTHIEKLRKLYESQIRKLGYGHFAYERISVNSRPLYRLIFCSRHSKGVEIWRRVSLKKPDNQQTWDF